MTFTDTQYKHHQRYIILCYLTFMGPRIVNVLF